MDMDMGMGGGGGAMAGKKKRYTSMTFFWGKNSEILFEGWPGTRGGHYALALIVCFFLALLVEWLSFSRFTKQRWSRSAVGATRIAVHVLRVGLAYLVMLAVMSFNGGVFIVVVAGHVLGYVLFGKPTKKDVDRDCCVEATEPSPSMKC